MHPHCFIIKLFRHAHPEPRGVGFPCLQVSCLLAVRAVKAERLHFNALFEAGLFEHGIELLGSRRNHGLLRRGVIGEHLLILLGHNRINLPVRLERERLHPVGICEVLPYERVGPRIEQAYRRKRNRPCVSILDAHLHLAVRHVHCDRERSCAAVAERGSEVLRVAPPRVAFLERERVIVAVANAEELGCSVDVRRPVGVACNEIRRGVVKHYG